MPKVSVIMPSLNVGKYIEECLTSVAKQTLKDIEIIVVDGGSTDGTLEIIERFAAADDRVRLLKADKKSYGHQMNLGLAAATGEYIGIVETDDFIEPDMYEILYRYADTYELDYVKGAVHVLYDLSNGARYIVPSADLSITYKGVVCPANVPQILFRDVFIWSGIYRHNYLKDVKFNETSGAAYQDQGFLLQTISRAQRAMYINSSLYFYRQSNPDASQYDPRSFKYIYDEYTLNEPFANKLEVSWQKNFYARLCAQCLWRFNIMALEGAYWKSAQEYIAPLQRMLAKAKENQLIDYDEIGPTGHGMFYLLLRSPQAVYEYYQYYHQSRINKMSAILQWAENKEIIVWGCGKWGRFIQAVFLRNGVNVVAFVDSDSALWGTTIQNSKVISPQYTATDCKDKYFCVAVKKFAYKIQQDLLSWGVPAANIFYQDIVVDTMSLITPFKEKFVNKNTGRNCGNVIDKNLTHSH